MSILLALLLLVAQTDLPAYGKIEQIKTFTRVYVASHNEDSRGRVVKALEKDKSLSVVNSPEEAQFFLEYEELSREATASGNVKERQQRSQMRAYLVADRRKVIVWSDTRSRETEHFMGMKMYDSGRNESDLTKAFLKELKKARGRT